MEALDRFKQLLVPTLVLSILFAIAITVPASTSFMSVEARLAYSYLGIPVIFVAVACAAAWRTRTRGWATLMGPGTVAGTMLFYLAVSLGIVLASRLLNAWLAILLSPVEASKHHLVTLAPPELTSQFLRSVVGSPISEELLFRGWLLTWLRQRELPAIGLGKRFSVDGSNLLVSLSFGLMHLVTQGSVYTMIGVALISLVFGAARLRSGGLLLPMLCHALVNLVNATFLVWRV